MFKLMRGSIVFSVIAVLAVFSACSNGEQAATKEQKTSQEHAGHEIVPNGPYALLDKSDFDV